MKTTSTILLSVLLLTGSPLLTAQEKADRTGQLIEQLGDPDYETRKRAEQELMKLGAKAKAALKKSAKDHADPEVQWRAGRLLRRIESGAKGTTKALGKRRVRKDGERIEGKVERNFERETKGRGDRPGRGRRVDPFERLDDIFDRNGIDGDARKQIERAMKQLREQMRGLDDFGGGFRGGFDVDFPKLPDFPKGFGNFGESSNRSMKITQGPDGVRVEVTEKGKDGKTEKKVYEADDMESFQKKYPDVLGKGPVRFGFGTGPGTGTGKGFGFETFPGFRNRLKVFGPGANPFERLRGKKELRKKDRKDANEDVEVEEVAPPKSEGKKLGFYVGEVAPAVRDYLDLKGGLGVAEVAEDSIASKLGMRAGDIVVQVGKRKIYAVRDVAEALEELGDKPVTVKVIRKGKEVTLR